MPSAAQTRKFIIDHLPSGAPRQAVIANDLNMSLRNFQGKLPNMGTSYSKLLNQVRHEMAHHYLRTDDYQVIEIAYLLGYADPSNFSRAFKRWTGLSPNQYRDQALPS
jgi:AraC-like DNA-binding protein